MSKGKAIGIDLGTTYSCVAVWEHDRAEVIVNDRGNRTTPSVVAFTPSERFVGDAPKYQIANNPHNTVFDAKRLIGRRFTDSSVQSDAHLWPFTVVAGDNGEPVIQVEYKGERRMFAAKEISSMDADGSVPFFWGTAPDGCLVLSDDPHELKEGCGKCFAPFPRGCFFSTSGGLQSFEHPLNKLMPMPRVDSKGQMCGANFKVDVFAKRQTSMPRVGSEANSAKEF